MWRRQKQGGAGQDVRLFDAEVAGKVEFPLEKPGGKLVLRFASSAPAGAAFSPSRRLSFLSGRLLPSEP